MGAWSADSKTKVEAMKSDDFTEVEQSLTMKLLT
jgi:monomeric isocitrate dehydrogenase